jgi:Fe2+ transport system protein FeoA
MHEKKPLEVIVNEALKFIDKNVIEKKPFFTVIWDGSPHDPFESIENDKKGFENLNKESREHYGEIVAFDRSLGILRNSLFEMGISRGGNINLVGNELTKLKLLKDLKIRIYC